MPAFISRILLCKNSLRLLNNLPMGCSVRHILAIGNVISGKGIIGKPNVLVLDIFVNE